MTDSEDSRRREAWSAYWASGRLHSCTGSYGGNYGGAIGRFWRGTFGRLPATSRVLDLATGNGPLPLLLWEQRKGRVEVDAVDLAMLAPDWHVPSQHPGIHFHSGVSMEALPFAPSTFDCVISQFGFEYADRQRALDECLRVAKPEMLLAFVMHHAGSVLVRVGREELAHHSRLLAGDGLIEAARDAIPWIARARTGAGVGDQAAASAARVNYNRATQDLAVAAQASFAPDLLLEAREAVHGLLGLTGGDARESLARLDAYRLSLEEARLRTAEMVAHALEPEQLEQLVHAVHAARPHAVIEVGELRQSEGVLGWSFVAAPGAAVG